MMIYQLRLPIDNVHAEDVTALKEQGFSDRIISNCCAQQRLSSNTCGSNASQDICDGVFIVTGYTEH
jgi:hypothetical protein